MAAMQMKNAVQMIMQNLMQKKCSDAENCADAICRTVVRAEHLQMLMQYFMQEGFQPQRGDLFIDSEGTCLPVAPAERPIPFIYRSLRWSYRNRWLAVIYKQVAPMELKCRAVIRADDLQKNDTDAETVCRNRYRNELQKPCRKNAPMQYCLQMLVQMSVQFSVQIF